MILYQLKCETGHQFEAWFRDGATFDSQCAHGDVECPFCGDYRVAKAPMAPNVVTRSAAEVQAGERASDRAQEVAEQILDAVEKLREHVEETGEDVGDQFAGEARRIQYGESEERTIYGDATAEEAAELDEEGVDYFRLPQSSRRDD